MQQTEAIHLIKNDYVIQSAPQTWADLGCGAGTFTLALASLLHKESVIFAVDKDEAALRKIPEVYNEVTIYKRIADFTKEDFLFTNLDGVLMANALHFIKNKTDFIYKFNTYLKEDACWLIVEYETSRANPWVPYPARYHDLEKLFKDNGYNNITKLREAPSKYHNAMYATLIKK